MPERLYYVEYIRQDIWIQPVTAQNKQEAREKFRDGDFDTQEAFWSHYGGDGKISEITREDNP